MKWLKNDIRPEIAAFLSGAFVMIFEILWARIIAPYIGNSIFVWTSIISVVLWALALWYYYWWKLADRWANLSTISLLFTIAWVFFLLLPFIKDPILSQISENIRNIQVASLLASLFLLTPMSYVLWAISPIATKIHMHDLHSSWKVIGRVWSIGTVWSIVWTLAAWFILIPQFGVVSLLLLLSIWCIAVAWICNYKKYFFLQIFIVLVCFFAWWYNNDYIKKLSLEGTHIIDTAYSHVTVSESVQDYRAVKKLYIDNITHAWMYMNSLDLVHEYTKYYDLFNVLNPDARDLVMFWWAAYGYPKHFLSLYPEKHIDVVEIDPKITEIAKEHFNLQDDSRLGIFHGDARVFLNTVDKQYDTILWDAFGSYFSIPYQLTTRETVQQKYDLLNDNGVVILNLISSLEWPKAKFLEAQYHTYKQIFPEVFIIPVSSYEKYDAQNIILIAAKNPEELNFETQNNLYTSYLSKKKYLNIPEWTKILTDDYAPVDSYISELTK